MGDNQNRRTPESTKGKEGGTKLTTSDSGVRGQVWHFSIPRFSFLHRQITEMNGSRRTPESTKGMKVVETYNPGFRRPWSTLAFFDWSIFIFGPKMSRRQEEPEAEAFDVEMNGSQRCLSPPPPIQC